MKALKELPSSASRYHGASSPPRLIHSSGVPRRPLTTSRVLAALDADAGPSSAKRQPSEDIIDLTTPTPPKKRRSLTTSPIPTLTKPDFTKLDEDPSASGEVKENQASAVSLPKQRKPRTTKKPASAPAKTSPLEEQAIPSTNEVADGTQATVSSKPAAKPTMPLYTYRDTIPKPTVMYIQTEEEADEVVQALNGPVGFDLEWRVFIRRGARMTERRTALVQLCDSTMILLLQVSSMQRFPQKLKELIESPHVAKMGANIRNDGMKLYRDFGILARNLVELGGLARQADERFQKAYSRSIVSLAKVIAFYLRRSLDKGPVRTSNWEAQLTREQMEYAANDVYCSLTVYKRCLALARESKRTVTPSDYTTDLYVEMNPPPAPARPEPSVAEAVATPTASTSTVLGRSSMADDTEEPLLRPPPRPQELRAYMLWRRGDGLASICASLRSRENPLKDSTVMYGISLRGIARAEIWADSSYVVNALDADQRLRFSMKALKVLVQMEAGSWTRHRDVIARWYKEGRGAEESVE
ncbi:hypothetical protein EWM64_g3659 [Hericium alpestre]|uniref:3'-5' exonuclease domain-containing protein n=1 Tax=Hericium alpestre TaxID=135208 RepID=A0A4Y9ZZU0_9AGAM|nr:hypothetical protein EWM64_g3659 [Hericium alpestre]